MVIAMDHRSALYFASDPVDTTTIVATAPGGRRRRSLVDTGLSVVIPN